MDIRSLYTIASVDNTRIEVELAGFAPRLIAALIDTMINLLMLGCILIALVYLKNIAPELVDTIYNLFFPKGTLAIAPMVLFLVLFSGSYVFGFTYYFLQEWLCQGQTLGKMVMRLRVVKEDGQPIGFWEAFGRNLLRFFMDVYPAGFGLLAILFSSKEKRFGDYLVGTLVIRENAVKRGRWQREKPLTEQDALGNAWLAVLTGTERALEKNPQFEGELAYVRHHLNPAEVDWIQQFLSRAGGIGAGTRRQLLEEAVSYFRARLNLTPLQKPTDVQLVQFLYQLEAHTSAPATEPPLEATAT